MNSNSTPSEAVRLANVALSFPGGVRVLNDLNLSVPAGAAAALTGPSGAGKTSLLAVIAGLLRQTGGEAETLGHDLGKMDEDQLAELRRTKIGVVFQHFHLLETMTAHENAALPLQLIGDSEADDKAAEALKSVGLSHRMGHFPSQLSGGEQQRTAIARAFSIRPQLLLADEPTGNLDHDTGREVLDLLIESVRRHNTTLLFVTHNHDILKRFDVVHVLRGGALHER